MLLLLLLLDHVLESSCLSTTATTNTKNTLPAFRAAVYQCQKPPTTASSSSPLYDLHRITDALQRAANHNVELVVFPEWFLGDNKRALSWLDREASELNVIGQLAQAFEVACVVPFAEKEAGKSSSSSDTTTTVQSTAMSSTAIFHCDGSRAGTYTSLASGGGNPFVETLPVTVRLKSGSLLTCAILTLEDLLTSPEHGRHMVRMGAQLLLAPGAQGDPKILQHVVIARAMENRVPVLCANLEGPSSGTNIGSNSNTLDDDGSEENVNSTPGVFVGLSGIISPEGEELIRAPVYHEKAASSSSDTTSSTALEDGEEQEEEEDNGRVVVGVEGSSVIPCNGGELYVGTVENLKDASLDAASPLPSCIEDSKRKWDIVPKNTHIITNGVDHIPVTNLANDDHVKDPPGQKKVSKGFGVGGIETLRRTKGKIKTKRKQGRP
jgi:predicted amidohydrolase